MQPFSVITGLEPALVYIAESPYRRGEYKIGTANREDLRMKAGRTWLSNLEVVLTASYADALSAETAAKQHFSHLCVDGEWFTASLGEIRSFLNRLSALAEPERQSLRKKVGICIELGLLAPEDAPTINTAVDAILAWRLPRLKTTVRSELGAALTGLPGAACHAGNLARFGFVVRLGEGVVLVDLNQGSALVQMLDRTVGAGRWEHQMRDIAGFLEDGSTITLKEWLCSTAAEQPLRTKIANAHRRLPE